MDNIIFMLSICYSYMICTCGLSHIHELVVLKLYNTHVSVVSGKP